jgi:hypothetical protein
MKLLLAALKRRAGQALLFLLPVLFFAAPLHARSWRIADYNDTIAIAHDGSATVHEQISIVFVGSFQGIHRTIPVHYPGPNGTNYTLFVDVKSVTDGNGTALRYESHTSGDFRDLKIYLPGAEDTTKTVVIDYSVRNGVRFFPDHDEF